MIYVDAMRNWGKRIGRAGPYWAHLLGDTPEELHACAAQIGLQRRWFQGDHYDIGSRRIYTLALAHGAIVLSGQEWLQKVSEIRKVYRV